LIQAAARALRASPPASRRRPRHEEVPHRAVHVEDEAEHEERERLVGSVRRDELRQEREEEERDLRVERVGEAALEEYRPQRRGRELRRLARGRDAREDERRADVEEIGRARDLEDQEGVRRGEDERGNADRRCGDVHEAARRDAERG